MYLLKHKIIRTFITVLRKIVRFIRSMKFLLSISGIHIRLKQSDSIRLTTMC